MVNFRLLFLILCFILFSKIVLMGSLYEGFDLNTKKGSELGQAKALGGATSYGWMSSWQQGRSKAEFSKEDLHFEALASSGGSVKIIGERKESHIGKGYLLRQTDTAYSGTVYGSFRLKPGFFNKESVFGLVFSLPNVEEVSPKNGIFSICPKRWGGALGMIGAKGRNYKVVDGIPCEKGQKYLVVWKLSNLPMIGEASDLSMKFWVLNEAQVEYFAQCNFAENQLNLAEPGSAANEVCQFGRQDLKESKRSLYKGIVLIPFVYNVTNVLMDEFRIVSTNFADAVGFSN